MRSWRARSLFVSLAAAVAATLFPASAGAGPTPADGPPTGERFMGGRAVPIQAEAPAWYTEAFHHKVVRAGTEGVRLPAGANVEASFGLAYPGIRPGQWLITIDGGGFAWCSANFVFQKSGTYGLGTAGHCTDSLGSPVTAYVVPPPTSGRLPGIYAIGRITISHDNGIGDDFAMVEIFPEFSSWVNPTMPVWGGPIGVYTSNAPTVVQHFGHGLVIGTGGTPRAGAALVWTARNGSAFAWYGAGLFGDSGSGVRVVTGEAAGNFTHIVVYDGNRRKLVGEIPPGMLTGTRMTKILQIAGGWSLVNGSIVPV